MTNGFAYKFPIRHCHSSFPLIPTKNPPWIALGTLWPYFARVIALLDYGSGNLRSVHKALLKVGADVHIAQTPAEMTGADAVVLPGVGAFDDCINALRKQELLEASKRFIESGKPFLGICVGYQALFERSEEFNSCAAGLGVFQGSVVRFSEKDGLKIPQIGWNQLEGRLTPECPLYRGIREQRQLRLFRPQLFPKAEGSQPSSPRARPMVRILRLQYGAIMFSPRNSTRKKARKLDCSC